jgi:hypothetical protein
MSVVLSFGRAATDLAAFACLVLAVLLTAAALLERAATAARDLALLRLAVATLIAVAYVTLAQDAAVPWPAGLVLPAAVLSAFSAGRAYALTRR